MVFVSVHDASNEVELAEQEMSQFEAGSALNRIEMSQSLRGSLQRAITYAHEQFHRQVTLEHLLLALTDDRDAAAILEASAVNVPSLLTEVSDYLGRHEDRAMAEPRQQPALGRDIQHIIQSAGAAAEKSKRSAVSSALVLAAIVGDGRSPSAQMLRNQGMTFETAIAALKQANAAETAKPVGATVASNPPQPAVRAMPGQAHTPAPSSSASANGPSTGGDGARLQNMQAAHEIIANARERIASARGTVANHAAAAKAGVSEAPPVIAAPSTPVQPAPVSSLPAPAVSEAPVSKPAPAQAEPTTPSGLNGHQDSARPPSELLTVAPAASRPPAAPQAPVPSTEPATRQATPPSDMPPQSVEPPPQRSAPPHPAMMMPPQAAPHQQAPPHRPPLPNQPIPSAVPAPPPQAPPRNPAQQPNAFDDVPPTAGRSHGPAAAPHGYNHPPQSEARSPRIQSSDLAPVVRPIDPEKLAEFVPTRMRYGVPTTVEIRAPRARLEAWSGGNADPTAGGYGEIITKAMVMRLKAPEGGFTVEIASPETQWSEGFAGPLSDDVVSWRWIVTPKQRGRLPLLLSVSTRVVGRDGLAAARTLPEQVVDVRVAPNYGRLAGRLMLWIFLAASGTALGYFGDRLFSMGTSMLAQVIN